MAKSKQIRPKPPKKYNKKMLEKLAQEYNIQGLRALDDNFDKHTIVEGKCLGCLDNPLCTEIFKWNIQSVTENKKFRCKKCSRIHNSHIFCKEGLEKFCDEKNIELLPSTLSLEKICCSTVIEGYCIADGCSDTFRKRFGDLYKYGSYFCKSHYMIEINRKTRQTHLDMRGYTHPSKDPEIKSQKIETNMARRGVINPFQAEDVKDMRSASLIDAFGTVNYVGLKPVQDKMIATNLRKRRVKYFFQSEEFKEKSRKTMLRLFDVEHYTQSKEFKEKSKKTSLKIYGTEYPMQNPEVIAKRDKNSYKRKPYEMPSGEIVYIQGYEDSALDELLDSYEEDDLLIGVKNVPVVSYIKEDNSRGVHFADFFIQSEQKFVEVKSTWTAKFSNVINKLLGANEEGYQYEIWVYSGNRNKNKRIKRFVWTVEDYPDEEEIKTMKVNYTSNDDLLEIRKMDLENSIVVEK